MTRINAGIPVEKLCDQHLLAEHREIVRVRLTQNSKKNPIHEFKLGTGHIIFFKNKLGYIFNRYQELLNECLSRGFNVTNMSESFKGFDLIGQYSPNDKVISLVKERIILRLSDMKNIRFHSKIISFEEAKNLLN